MIDIIYKQPPIFTFFPFLFETPDALFSDFNSPTDLPEEIKIQFHVFYVLRSLFESVHDADDAFAVLPIKIKLLCSSCSRSLCIDSPSFCAVTLLFFK